MAQSVIGALRVNLGLNSAQFQNGLRNSQTRLSSFKRNLVTGLAVAAAASAAAFSAMTARAMGFIDDQSKVARSVDGTIDALRALQIAGGDAGVSKQDLNKSLQMLSARLVEAQVKGGATADALARIGLNAAELSGMDVDNRMATIADRMKELGYSSAQAAQFLMDMGVRSKEMALLMVQGGDAIRAARQEVKDLGLSLNSVDAGKVEEANDAMSRMSLVGEALSNRFAVALAPALTKVSQAFAASMREGGSLRIMIDGIGSVVGGVIGFVGDFVTILDSMRDAIASNSGGDTVFAKIANAVASVVQFSVGAVAWVGRLVGGFASLIRVSGGFGEAVAALAPLANEVWQRIGNGVDFIRSSIAVVVNKMAALFYAGLRKMAGGWVDFTWAIADGLNEIFGTSLTGASARITQELAKLELASRAAADAAGASASSLKSQFGAPLSSLEDLRNKVAQTTEDASEDVTALGDTAVDLGDRVNQAGGGGAAGLAKIGDKAKEIKGQLQPLKDSLKSMFTGIVSGAKSGKDALRDLLGKLAEMAASSAFEKLWANLGGGKAASGGGFLSGLFGGVKTFLGFANGTSSAPGGLSWVGERGKELVNLPKGSQVVPHSRSQLMAQGGASGVLQVALSPGLHAEWLGDAGQQSAVQIGYAGHVQNKQLPGRISSMQSRGGAQ